MSSGEAAMTVEAAPVSDLETAEPIDLVDELLACSNDPLRWVELAFADIRVEDWQGRVLRTIGEQLSENARLSTFKPIQIAVASGNTVGKTALLAWRCPLWANFGSVAEVAISCRASGIPSPVRP
jgi:hypothetical protein